MPDTGPKARSIPAGGNAPCDQRNKSPSANGAVHPFRVVRWWVVNGAWRWDDGAGFQPSFCPSMRYLGRCPRLVWRRAVGAPIQGQPASVSQGQRPVQYQPGPTAQFMAG